MIVRTMGVGLDLELPGPACSVWPSGSVHHVDPRDHLVTDTEVMSSFGPQCQTLMGKRGPLVPKMNFKKRGRGVDIICK